MKPPTFDPEEKERRKLLLDQQAQIVALRNTIQEKRRRLDQAFHYNEIRQLEDEKINLGKQLQKLNVELQDARKDDDKQIEMVEALDNGVFSKQNEKKLKQNLLSAKLESKMMSEQRADIERELNEKHILKISVQRELRDLKAKIAEATNKRNKEAENPPPDHSDEAFDALRQKIKEVNYQKEVLSVDFEEEMLNLELLTLELKKEKSQLEASLKEKKWNSRHNQVRIKELQRIVRFREAIGTKTASREVLYTNRDEDVEYFVEQAEMMNIKDEENQTLNGKVLGNSQGIDTVVSKDESKTIPKVSGMTSIGSKGTEPQDSSLAKPKPLPKLEPISGVSGINGKTAITHAQGNNPSTGVKSPTTVNQQLNPSELGKSEITDKKVQNLKNNDGKETPDNPKVKNSDGNQASKQLEEVRNNPVKTNLSKNNDPVDKHSIAKENTLDNAKVVDSSIKIIEKPSEKGKENFESKIENQDNKNYPNKQPLVSDPKSTPVKPDPAKKTEINDLDKKLPQKPSEIPKNNSKPGAENGTEKDSKLQSNTAPHDASLKDQDKNTKVPTDLKNNTNDKNSLQKPEAKPSTDGSIKQTPDQKGQDTTLKMTSKTPTFTDPSKLPGNDGKKIEEKMLDEDF